MKKLPAIQFYFGDWKKDPALAMCSLSTRGFWHEILGAMHELGRSGQITGTAQQLARVCRCTAAEAEDAINELKETRAADVSERNGVFTLINRRMKREFDERNSGKQRVQKFRQHKNVTGGNGNVTKQETVEFIEESIKQSECNGNVTLPSSSSTSIASISYSNEKEIGGGGKPPPAAVLSDEEKRMTKDEFTDHLRKEFACTGDVDKAIDECVDWYKTNKKKPPNRLQVKKWLAEEYEDFDLDAAGQQPESAEDLIARKYGGKQKNAA